MKKLLLIIAVLSLVGCSLLPQARPAWPEAPAEIQKPAPDLTPLGKDQHNLSDLIENANINYSEYFALKNKYNAWIEWYNTQKKIYDNSK